MKDTWISVFFSIFSLNLSVLSKAEKEMKDTICVPTELTVKQGDKQSSIVISEATLECYGSTENEEVLWSDPGNN